MDQNQSPPAMDAVEYAASIVIGFEREVEADKAKATAEAVALEHAEHATDLAKIMLGEYSNPFQMDHLDLPSWMTSSQTFHRARQEKRAAAVHELDLEIAKRNKSKVKLAKLLAGIAKKENNLAAAQTNLEAAVKLAHKRKEIGEEEESDVESEKEEFEEVEVTKPMSTLGPVHKPRTEPNTMLSAKRVCRNLEASREQAQEFV